MTRTTTQLLGTIQACHIRLTFPYLKLLLLVNYLSPLTVQYLIEPWTQSTQRLIPFPLIWPLLHLELFFSLLEQTVFNHSCLLNQIAYTLVLKSQFVSKEKSMLQIMLLLELFPRLI